ncbi:hypothetical protein AK830_g3997 [Neonectria ditissima]|uniref:Uncharacterized protein n=1 Tax=Neonectria ditissima TaxID=78410 RepID=A0A0P7BA28_9HYPO|nr:hypothetical protein AK830_g3997 [Neonectria ditissima]
MGKFSFGSRKKPAPQVTVTAPMSKAQKILGANALSIDSEFSSSKVSLAATERSTAAASRASSIRGSPRVHRLEREWGDESDIVPRHLRGHAPRDDEEDYDEYDDIASDMVSVLRKRQSASTLASWYDKSKQPLSISQQTSNSAMAKGMPSKAHKMLDMGNTQTNAKPKKKKPAKLDLSHLMSRKSKKTTPPPEPPWEGPILGSDQVVKSPSLLSPLTSPSRGRLNRRPTQESLRSEPARPGTMDSNRRVHNLEGLPNLYEHYEQMSFRQVIDQELKHPEDESREKPKQQEAKPSKPHHLLAKPAHHVHLPHHDEAVISQYAKRILPQTPQGSLINKAEASSPTDCAASVSSRHTRTSKASKRTDRSFQESDLQEKSVLSLSSDSEDDMYLASSFKGPASVPDYPTSDASSTYDHRPATSRTSSSVDNKRSSKRSSQTPSSNFLTIPNGHHIKAPAVTTRSSSLSGSSANTIQEGTAPRSPSQISLISNSSVNTAMTWQSKPGFGLQQARAITLQNAQGPFEDEESEPELEQKHRKEQELALEPEDDLETSHVQAGAHPDSMTNATDQPTPPLSPSSVDFYMRSAHSSIDGQTSHNRIMAVTRQEEMLLAALRHKRQVMRETILHEIEDNARGANPVPKGHQSQPSEATITESSFDLDFPSPPNFDLNFPAPPNFDLDFPAPPMCKDRTAVAANGKTVIDLRRASSHGQLRATNVAKSHPQAVPALPSSKKALLKAQQEISRTNQQERILLYLDHPHKGEKGIVEEAEPSPDLSDFMAFETEEAEDAGDVVSEAILYSSQSSHSSGRSGQRGTSKRRSDAVNRKILDLSPDRAAELGVPRPDSPISPDSLSAMPRRDTVNKKTARLSAVGPARWGYED